MRRRLNEALTTALGAVIRPLQDLYLLRLQSQTVVVMAENITKGATQ